MKTTDLSHLLSDHNLVAKAQSGDPDALDVLITAVRPAVLKYCRSRLHTYAGGFEMADDVAQETCVALMRALPRYQNQGAPFASFVYAIAANKVADAQRRFSRSAMLVEEFPEQVEQAPNPEETVLASVDVTAAQQLLSRLPERMREVLMMRAHGISADAIGERLNMTANAVRVAQHRAGAKLRQLIEESEEHRELFEGFGAARNRRKLQLAS